jgi:hypothetical protein
VIGWGRTAHGQSDTPSKLQVTENYTKDDNKDRLCLSKFAAAITSQGVSKNFISLLILILLTQIQYNIFTIHFYEAFLVIIENDYVLPIRDGQLLYIKLTVIIFATGHIYLASIVFYHRLEFPRIIGQQPQVHMRLS